MQTASTEKTSCEMSCSRSQNPLLVAVVSSVSVAPGRLAIEGEGRVFPFHPAVWGLFQGRAGKVEGEEWEKLLCGDLYFICFVYAAPSLALHLLLENPTMLVQKKLEHI